MPYTKLIYAVLLFASLGLTTHVGALEMDAVDPMEGDVAVTDNVAESDAEPDESNAERAFADAVASLESGNTERAELLFTALSKTQPDLAGPYLNLGIIYSQTDRLGKAEGALLRSVTLNSENPHAYNYLGIVYRKIGRFKDALENYEKALELSPNLADVHLNIGILYDLYLFDAMKALEHYQRFQTLNGNDEHVEKWIVEVTRRIKRMRR